MNLAYTSMTKQERNKLRHFAQISVMGNLEQQDSTREACSNYIEQLGETYGDIDMVQNLFCSMCELYEINSEQR